MRIQNSSKSVMMVVLTLGILAASAYAETAGRNPADVKKQFDEVAARLDTGGDLYAVANVDGLLQSLVNQIVGLTALAPTNDPSAATIKMVVGRIPVYLQKNGFYAAHAWGMSAVPHGDGMNTIKVFLSRDPSAANLPLWKGLAGDTKQRRLAGLDYLPADTVMARGFNGNLTEIWKLFRQGVKEIAQPAAAAAFDRRIAGISSNLDISVDKLIASIGDEGFVSIQFARDTTISLPLRGGATDIPTPSILIGVAVKDGSLLKVIDAHMAKKAVPVIKAQAGDTLIESVNLPVPLPVPIEPTYAMCSGFFLFGSNSKVVTDAVTAFEKKSGLAASDDFKNAFKNLPAENNGFVYISPRFAKLISDIESKSIGARAAASGQNEETSALLRKLMANMAPQPSAFVILNYDNGILLQGNSASSGRAIIAGLAIAPVGLMAAIAIPSFVKARNTSQKNACINNLRIIDAAKEQWAMANRKKDGDEVDIDGIKEYMKGGKMPVCPAGGVYKINPIGTMPECSCPDHKMNW